MPIIKKDDAVVLTSIQDTLTNQSAPLNYHVVDYAPDGRHAVALEQNGTLSLLALLDHSSRLGWIRQDRLMDSDYNTAQTRIFSTSCTGTITIHAEDSNIELELSIVTPSTSSPTTESNSIRLVPVSSPSPPLLGHPRGFVVLPHSILSQLNSSATTPPQLLPRDKSTSPLSR